ncbi:hypothetical protein [Cardinium endosymbiont of Tipula unca]
MGYLFDLDKSNVCRIIKDLLRKYIRFLLVAKST